MNVRFQQGTLAHERDAFAAQLEHQGTVDANDGWNRRWNSRAEERCRINSPWPEETTSR